MAKKKKSLVEMYRIKEGPYDDINKSLSTAKSVAGNPSGQAQKPRVGADGASQKAQTDLDNSKSIFDETLGDDQGIAVNLTPEEINWVVSLAQRSQGTAWPYGEKAPRGLADKLNAAERGPESSSSSMSSTRSVGSVGMK